MSDVQSIELEAAPANSNPVARWVEAVQPWMPGNNEAEDSQEMPDWTSRAKGEPTSNTSPFILSAVVHAADTMRFSLGVPVPYAGLCETRPPQAESR
jgi:hypothetical protein